MIETSNGKKLLYGQPVIINIGLDIFLKAFEIKRVKYLNIDWRPPAKGNEKLIEALRKISE